MAAKKIWQSKTLWINAIAFIAGIIQSQTGFVVAPEIQAGGLAVINFILRFITKEPLA